MSVTPKRVTSVSTASGERSWRLSERSSRCGCTTAPDSVGRPPRSRMLTTPSRSIHWGRYTPAPYVSRSPSPVTSGAVDVDREYADRGEGWPVRASVLAALRGDGVDDLHACDDPAEPAVGRGPDVRDATGVVGRREGEGP